MMDDRFYGLFGLPQYRYVHNLPMEAYVRITSEEEAALRLIKTGLFWSNDPKPRVREMVGPEIFEATMAKCRIADELQQYGVVVEAVVIDEFPLDDII